MRRFAPLALILLLLSACGGPDAAQPVTSTPPVVTGEVPSTSLGETGDPAARRVGEDPMCQELGSWLGAVAFGGPASSPVERIRAVSGSLEEPRRSQLLAAVGSSTIDFGAAAALDVEIVALCGFPLAEGAHIAARNGAPDCYLDGDRDVIVDVVCEFGGQPLTVATPELSDPAFCGTTQDFNRRGAGSLTGQPAIDELNRFVGAAPNEVERLLRDIVSSTSSGDTEDQLRDLFALDRLVSAGCADEVANAYLSLVEAAIAAVPPPTTSPAPGQPPADDPGQLAGGSPYVTLCQGIERRFAGSAASEWGLVLNIAVSANAPGDVVSILTQLADPEVKGEEARAPLVAALQPFLDGPCQNTGLDESGSEGPTGNSPEEEAEAEDEEQGIPSLL